nr:6K2 [Verbena virus Y]
STGALAKDMRLKGIWCKSLLARDVIIAGAVLTGGGMLLWTWFKDQMNSVSHQ